MAAAATWPSAMRDESDVLTLDEHGQFVVCRVCCAQYAIYGGQEPGAVAMSALFCTQAWVEHKRIVHEEPPPKEVDTVVKTEQEGQTERLTEAARGSGDVDPSVASVDEAPSQTTSSREQRRAEILPTDSGVGRKRSQPVPIDDTAAKRPRPSEAPKTELYWRTLRNVYASDKRPGLARVGSCSSRASTANSLDNTEASSSSKTLLTSIRNLTSTLMMREMETQSARPARTESMDALRRATVSLAAMQRRQRRAFSRMLSLQERNLERLHELLRNRRSVSRGEPPSSVA